jgi:hypothetical protein
VGSDKVEKRIILYNDSDRFIDYFLFLKETATAFNTNLYPGLFYCSTRTNHQFPCTNISNNSASEAHLYNSVNAVLGFDSELFERVD